MLSSLVCALSLLVAPPDATDSDGDGLSDFHEVHKHFTDPEKADSDGDGVPDGDWRERREYQYVVRTVVHVRKPVTPDFLTDDHQDARVLDETDEHVELEVIHYPYTTVADAIEADPKWRRAAKREKRWLEPGPTSNWDAGLKRDLEKALAADGIDAKDLDDRTLVERASRWLCDHAAYQDGFSTFVTGFDERGRPFVPEALAGGRDRASFEEQWTRELFAKGMFEHGARGSCTSSAIYLSGCLRALGIPTRTILTIPVIDANDDHELALVERGIRHAPLRRQVLAAAKELRGSWASHTFNEVFVGGRWRRLNYAKLGQGIADPGLFGLITHVATFHDWADARMHETVGRRQETDDHDDVCGGRNPYSTIAIRDEVGPHATFELGQEVFADVEVVELLWSDDRSLPEDVRAGLDPKGREGLVAVCTGPDGFDGFTASLGAVDATLAFEGDGATLFAELQAGCWWRKDDRALVWVRCEDLVRLRSGATFAVRAPNEDARATLSVREGLTVARQ